VLTSSSQGGLATIGVAGLSAQDDRQVYFVGAALNDGDFESSGLGSWTVGGSVASAGAGPVYTATVLSSDRVGAISVMPHSGGSMARLGATTSDNTSHELSEVWLRQPVYVPSTGLTQVTFWYRLLSYDVSVGSASNGSKEWDPFEVYVNGLEVLQDGYPFSAEWYAWYLSSPTSPRDMGWKQGVLDLTPYAGQIIVLEFRVPNRQAPLDNTWVYVDGINIQQRSSNYSVFLPFVVR
jgi:hypothetical protein